MSLPLVSAFEDRELSYKREVYRMLQGNLFTIYKIVFPTSHHPSSVDPEILGKRGSTPSKVGILCYRIQGSSVACR